MQLFPFRACGLFPAAEDDATMQGAPPPQSQRTQAGSLIRPIAGPPSNCASAAFALKKWAITQFPAIMLDKVEGVEGRVRAACRRDNSSNREKPPGPTRQAMTSIEIRFLRGRYSDGTAMLMRLLADWNSLTRRSSSSLPT
jgi:hypothetical protein